MALTSLMLNKKDADITATDYHREVDAFLKRNAILNDDAAIEYQQTDWSKISDTLGRFDLIIGSDILYEDRHIKQLADFIEHHSQPKCQVVLVDPARGRKNKLATLMKQYGFTVNHLNPAHTNYLDAPFTGHILNYYRD